MNLDDNKFLMAVCSTNRIMIPARTQEFFVCENPNVLSAFGFLSGVFPTMRSATVGVGPSTAKVVVGRFPVVIAPSSIGVVARPTTPMSRTKTTATSEIDVQHVVVDNGVLAPVVGPHGIPCWVAIGVQNTIATGHNGATGEKSTDTDEKNDEGEILHGVAFRKACLRDSGRMNNHSPTFCPA